MNKAVDKELSMEKVLVQNDNNKVQADNGNANATKYEYKREDCEKGYLTDPKEIEEFIRNQQIDIYQNALLGEYDNDGTYFIPDEIVDELVKSHKVITNKYENYIFAQSVRPIGKYGVAKFFITVSKLDNKLIATLTFVEPVQKINKLVINAQSFQIASFVGEGGEKFYYDMKREFNIVDDDFVVPSDKDKFEYALRRKKQRESIWEESLESIERTEKEIFNKRMEVLNKMDNEYTKGLLELFDGEMKKKGSFFNKAENKYTCMNQLLDECIAVMSGRFPEFERKALDRMRDVTRIYGDEQKQLIDIAKTKVAQKVASEKAPKTISLPSKEHSKEEVKKEPPKIVRQKEQRNFVQEKDINRVNTLGNLNAINGLNDIHIEQQNSVESQIQGFIKDTRNANRVKNKDDERVM